MLDWNQNLLLVIIIIAMLNILETLSANSDHTTYLRPNVTRRIYI